MNRQTHQRPTHTARRRYMKASSSMISQMLKLAPRLEFEKLVRDTGRARGDKTGELEPVRGDDVLPIGTGTLAARDLWWPARVQPPL